MRKFGIAVSLALAVGISSQASATVVTCSSTYLGLGTTSAPWGTEANGGLTLATATNVGSVAAGCQIGNLATNNVSGTGVFLSSTANPSIFEFVWGGGVLAIQEALGNNGTFPNGVDVELGLAANTLNSDHSLGTAIASINFSSPFVFAQFQTLYNANLAAGTYVIDTYGGTVGDDPTYQIDFTLGGAAVPEPGSLAIIGAALLGFGALQRRRRKSA